MESNFKIDGISNIGNQIFYGSETSNNIYISKVNDFADCAFTSPTRVVGEGALATLRGMWKGFVVQEDTMYISASKNQWYQMTKQLSSDNTDEKLDIIPLKTSANQGCLRQEAISHDSNSVVMLTNEVRLRTLGRTVNIFGTPMMTDYSYPIVKDFDMFDFTDASVKFWKNYVIVFIPKESKFYILNQTNPDNVFWEAPQTGAFSGASINSDGDLLVHDYNVPQTYKLFDGGSDNGNPILSRMKMAYTSFGNRSLSDYFNEYWLEGYISQNTELKITYNLDLDGCATTLNGIIKGDDTRIVCLLKDKGSLGKTSLGKHGLGNEIIEIDPDLTPSYFNAVLASPRKDFWKFSPMFESYGIDYDWQLLSFGPLITSTLFGNNSIKISLS
jgi:hypothetical protein